MVKYSICSKITNKHATKMCHLLGIEKVDIHICEYEQTPHEDYLGLQGNEAGLSTSGGVDTPQIYIYPRGNKDSRDTFGTLFHELIHVRLENIRNIGSSVLPVNKREEALYIEEEAFVRSLEKLFLAYSKKVY